MGNFLPPAQKAINGIRNHTSIRCSKDVPLWFGIRQAELFAEAIRENHQLRELCLDTLVDKEALVILADAIRGHPSLESVRLKQQNIPMDILRYWTDACMDLPQLDFFQLKEVTLSTGMVQHLTERAAQHPHLKGLCLSGNKLNDDAARHVVDMLKSKKDFQFLRLISCHLSDSAVVDIAEAASHQPDMVHFFIHNNTDNGRGSLLTPQLLAGGVSVNLSECHPASIVSKQQCSSNAELAKILVSELAQAELGNTRTDMLAYAQAWKHLPAMRYTRRLPTPHGSMDNRRAWELAKSCLENLPLHDADNPLLKADSRGICPAENPRTWQDAETFFRQLENDGVSIDKDWLSQKTPAGDTLLHCALAANARGVVPALNRRGITIGLNTLFDAPKRPSPLLQSLVVMDSCDAVFAYDNLKGTKSDTVREALNALPEHATRLVHWQRLRLGLMQDELATAQGR